jgi:hypothetical protein
MASELEVGKVRVSPANITAELQLYRDDSTINAAGTAIGDINFGGGDADNDNAARLRVKSDAAWTASSSPTAFEFQTCPSGSESPQTRLVIDSTGLASFSNGITVSGANNWSHITSSNDQSLSVADDAQVQLADVEAGAMMIHVYDRGAGHGAVIFATYFGQPELVAGSSTYFDVSDTDGKICVIKSNSSHDVYLKNRRGSTKQFSVLVTAGVLDDF